MADRREYLNRFKNERQERIMKRAGKPLIFDEDRMVRALLDREVPTMMQHCVLKVYKKMNGREKERYISAFNICAAVFQTHGYMRKRSFKLTGKGTKNNRRHQRETEASQKRGKFLKLTDRLWGQSMKRLATERKNKNKKK